MGLQDGVHSCSGALTMMSATALLAVVRLFPQGARRVQGKTTTTTVGGITLLLCSRLRVEAQVDWHKRTVIARSAAIFKFQHFVQRKHGLLNIVVSFRRRQRPSLRGGHEQIPAPEQFSIGHVGVVVAMSRTPRRRDAFHLLPQQIGGKAGFRAVQQFGGALEEQFAQDGKGHSVAAGQMQGRPHDGQVVVLLLAAIVIIIFVVTGTTRRHKTGGHRAATANDRNQGIDARTVHQQYVQRNPSRRVGRPQRHGPGADQIFQQLQRTAQATGQVQGCAAAAGTAAAAARLFLLVVGIAAAAAAGRPGGVAGMRPQPEVGTVPVSLAQQIPQFVRGFLAAGWD